MSMSKKDFIALADAIKNHNKQLSHINNARDIFTNSQLNVLAEFCNSTNVNFKRERWLDYIDGKCGKNGGKVKQPCTVSPTDKWMS